jgi:integrase
LRGLERNHEDKRAKYLNGEELRRLTDALAAYPNQVAANAIRVLPLTGARRGEVLCASSDQFDLREGTWTKPRSHTKQKREHRIPLSTAVRLLLTEMNTAADHCAVGARQEASPFLFPAQRRAMIAGEGCNHLVESRAHGA